MGSAEQTCNCPVGRSPARELIDRELLKPRHDKSKLTLRQLEALTGIARATIGRHGQKCLVRVALQHARKFNHRTDFLWLQHPNGNPGLQSVPEAFPCPLPAQPGPDDWLIEVQFEESPALSSEQSATAENTSLS